MQGVNSHEARVLVLGATNLPYGLDQAVRRRFDKVLQPDCSLASLASPALRHPCQSLEPSTANVHVMCHGTGYGCLHHRSRFLHMLLVLCERSFLVSQRCYRPCAHCDLAQPIMFTPLRLPFVQRIYIPLPEVGARAHMFKVHLGDTPNALTQRDFDELARRTDGFSGSDVAIVVKDVLMEPVRKTQEATHFRWLLTCCPALFLHYGLLMDRPYPDRLAPYVDGDKYDGTSMRVMTVLVPVDVQHCTWC